MIFRHLSRFLGSIQKTIILIINLKSLDFLHLRSSEVPFACFFPCSWNAYKREKCQTSRLKPYRKFSIYWKYRKSACFWVGCWLLAAGCYWRWLFTFVYLSCAFSHVLETLINGKSAKRHVWNPRKSASFWVGCWLLAAGCYSRWLLATGYVESAGCWLLLALAVHLCLPFACFFPCSWNAYRREKCQTSRLKPYRKVSIYWKYRKSAFFWVGCWLLVAGCYSRWLLAMYRQLATGCWLLLPLAAGYWLYAGLVAYNITFVYLLRAFSHILETLINYL